MNFMEAVKLMKAGKKCTCLVSNETYTMESDELSDELIKILHDGRKEYIILTFFHVESKWELFKEPKETKFNLSKTILRKVGPTNMYTEGAVKEFVDSINKKITHMVSLGRSTRGEINGNELWVYINKLAGDRF